MATNFPTSVDDGTTLPDPAAGNFQNSPSHSSLHGNVNGAIKAIEAKLGTGASTPSNNTFLIGNGTGTSAWGSLTSAQLASRISDETGSGLLVFATTPTLTTPKVDTINENTPANGVTIDGLNLKDAKLNTSDSVVTANITNTSVTADKMNLAAQTATIATTETTASTTYADLATVGPTVTVTVGVNGIILLLITSGFFNSGANDNLVSFSASGANTIAAADADAVRTNSTTAQRSTAHTYLTGLNAGATTIKLVYKVSAGTGSFFNRKITAIPL